LKQEQAMIERYTRPVMGQIWSLEKRYQTWLKVEVLACRAWARLGVIPEEAVRIIEQKAGFDPARIEAIEAETKHDVIAFLTNLAENVGEESRYIHFGLTSSDVLDTGLALQMRDAVDLILEEARGPGSPDLEVPGLRVPDTVMIGRTHGVHAEPTTFGHKLALWAFEMRRRPGAPGAGPGGGQLRQALGRGGHLREHRPPGGGYVCRRLGLRPAEVSTQVLQRDRHAEYLAALALTGATCEKMATEIRALQRTDILEAEEPFREGQKGSSAMPHKRNPIICERISGMARLLRGNALAALENVNLWHERDISHSSVERVIAPDATILLDFMLSRMTGLISRLVVYPERMKANLEASQGLYFSQQVLLALTKAGVSREEAYAHVQAKAREADEEKKDFRELIKSDAWFQARLGSEELARLFELGHHLRHVDQIFDRVFAAKPVPA
jgi:adenylosuccinate lyase